MHKDNVTPSNLSIITLIGIEIYNNPLKKLIKIEHVNHEIAMAFLKSWFSHTFVL